MRKLSLIFCLALFFSIHAAAQTNTTQIADTTEFDPLFTKAEVMPEFSGGLKAWQRFLEKNLDPKLAYNNGAPSGSYRVVVQFIVEKDGSLTQLKPLTAHGYGMEEEFIRILKGGPKWVPAKQNGRIVRCYHFQPLTLIVP
jgi:protein TonB